MDDPKVDVRPTIASARRGDNRRRTGLWRGSHILPAPTASVQPPLIVPSSPQAIDLIRAEAEIAQQVIAYGAERKAIMAPGPPILQAVPQTARQVRQPPSGRRIRNVGHWPPPIFIGSRTAAVGP